MIEFDFMGIFMTGAAIGLSIAFVAMMIGTLVRWFLKLIITK